jgi:hypothetical protein
LAFVNCLLRTADQLAVSCGFAIAMNTNTQALTSPEAEQCCSHKDAKLAALQLTEHLASWKIEPEIALIIPDYQTYHSICVTNDSEGRWEADISHSAKGSSTPHSDCDGMSVTSNQVEAKQD